LNGFNDLNGLNDLYNGQPTTDNGRKALVALAYPPGYRS
jgi:hypothetical protein